MGVLTCSILPYLIGNGAIILTIVLESTCTISRRELERLVAQIRQLEDARQEKEEEMWVMHDLHKQDIEEQKQHLAHLIKENQCVREQAEEEIKQTRENSKRQKLTYYKQIQAEMERLRKLEQKEHRELTVQTEAHQCTTLTSFDMEVETFSDSVDAAVDPSESTRVRKKSISDRMKKLEQEELKRKLSDHEMEICLAEQQENAEVDFLQKEEQVQMKIRKMEEMKQRLSRPPSLNFQYIGTQKQEKLPIPKTVRMRGKNTSSRESTVSCFAEKLLSPLPQEEPQRQEHNDENYSLDEETQTAEDLNVSLNGIRDMTSAADFVSLLYPHQSVSVELMEAKLNYTMGQTETLMQSIKEQLDEADKNCDKARNETRNISKRERVYEKPEG